MEIDAEAASAEAKPIAAQSLLVSKLPQRFRPRERVPQQDDDEKEKQEKKDKHNNK